MLCIEEEFCGRILQLWEEEEYYRNIEESMLIFAIPGSWFDFFIVFVT